MEEQRIMMINCPFELCTKCISMVEENQLAVEQLPYLSCQFDILLFVQLK